MKKTFILLLLSVILISCDNETEVIVEPILIDEVDITKLSKEEGLAHLSLWYSQIQSSINAMPCKDANDLKVVPIGAKGCGGPTGFVAYPKTEIYFFVKVEKFTEAQIAYNKKWGVISDCSIPQAPRNAACVNGKITLVY